MFTRLFQAQGFLRWHLRATWHNDSLFFWLNAAISLQGGRSGPLSNCSGLETPSERLFSTTLPSYICSESTDACVLHSRTAREHLAPASTVAQFTETGTVHAGSFPENAIEACTYVGDCVPGLTDHMSTNISKRREGEFSAVSCIFGSAEA